MMDRGPSAGRAANRVDEVHRALADAIERGDPPVGQRLPTENTLASHHGVSRPVVREAIARLAASGVVRTEHGKGTFVEPAQTVQRLTLAPITSIDDLIAWQELRIAIEQEAGRLAATRRSSEDLERIVRLNQKLEAANSNSGEMDSEFHVAIALATHNPAIVDAQRSLGNHIKHWVSAVLHAAPDAGAARSEYRLREHQAIIDTIARMDPDGAAKAIRLHIENGRTRFLTEMSRRRR